MTDIILLVENLGTILKLDDADAGALIKALIRHTDGEEPTSLPDKADLVYPFIRGQVDRMLALRDRNRENGKSGGRPRKNPPETQEKPKENTDETQGKAPVPVPVPVPVPLKESPTEMRKAPERFTPPTTEQVEAYCRENGYDVNPERFVAYYEAIDWKVGGKAKMKDWRAAVRNWSARDKKTERRIDYDEELRRMEYGGET